MSIDSNLRTLTLTNAAVVAQISNRFFIDHIPDSVTYPCVRATTVADPFDRAHSGTIGGRARVQLDTYDDDPTNCNAAADAINAFLDGYRGAMGNYKVTIQVKNRIGGWEAESRLFRRMSEVEIFYLNNV
ncbi:MAG TPA: hypothetical protein VIY48_15980 [Candidatus Paceibacterota bacterium]